MTTDSKIVEPEGVSVPIQAQPPCRFNGGRRKFKRACCCIAFILVINAFLLMHISRSIGAIAYFAINGSYTYDNTTYLFMPGGAQSFCNDFCVDMCIYKSVGCDMNHCLNTCNDQLEMDGNPDDFTELPEHDAIPIPLVDDTVDYNSYPSDPVYEYDEEDLMEQYTEEEDYEEEYAEQIVELDYVDYAVSDSDGVTGNVYLDKLHDGIVQLVDKVRNLKEEYQATCGDGGDTAQCQRSYDKITTLIKALNSIIEKYDNYAVSVDIEITVEIWIVDIDEVTADP